MVFGMDVGATVSSPLEFRTAGSQDRRIAGSQDRRIVFSSSAPVMVINVSLGSGNRISGSVSFPVSERLFIHFCCCCCLICVSNPISIFLFFLPPSHFS